MSATDFRGWGVVAALALVAGLGCKGDAPKGKSPPPSTEAPTEAPPGEVADVAFLIEACTTAGLPAAQCECAGEKAQTDLGAKLVSKMSKAPGDEDPTLDGYYTGGELQQVMVWVETSSSACGFEEVQ